jgi:hypothetical protein
LKNPILAAIWAVAAVSLVPAAAGQGASPGPADTNSPKRWSPPPTPNGQPDLQGIWTNATITPFERPKELAGKAFFTQQEAVDYERRVLQQSNRDQRSTNAEADVAGAYNDFWFDRGSKVVPTLRTSLVIDPPDGRVPPLTVEAQKAAAARGEVSSRLPAGPEDMGLPVRCLLWPTAGPPMLPGAYNNNYRILQTPGSVMILVEMIHDVRIIPLDGRPHLPATIRQWMGDPRGHWEGDTLVVDTTNFTNKTHFRGADENLHLVERFTRTGPDTILYQFTVDDPTAFTKSWTGEAPFRRAEGQIYEYACHEGNYAMTNMLRGARAQEKAASEAAKKETK